MRSNAEIQKIANEIYAETTKSIENLAQVKKTQVAALSGMGVDDGLAAIASITADVEAVIKAPRVNGVGLPQYLSKVIAKETGIETVTLSIRTRLKSAYKYRKDTEIATDENFIINLGKAYLDALYEMFYIEEAIANVNELNGKLAEIIAANEIPYGFEFAVNADTDAIVLEINNDKVVFNANISRAHDIASLGIFQSGDEYSELIAKESTDKLVAVLKTVQTPVQLIKANVEIIKDITGQSTKKRASKLIRASYHRQAKHLGGVKAGIGYFEETVKVGKEEVEVFALVEKAEDGSLTLVLNPFDIKTLFNVDYDVVAAVKKQLK